MTRVGWPVAPAAALLAACSEGAVVRPVIDTPAGDTVFADVDTIELSVAIDGDSDPLVSKIFRRGETLELTDVPYGENLVIHMLGRNNSEVGYGRTCRFAVRPGQAAPSPHLYFARTVRWADGPMPPSAIRIGGAALTSRNGSGLFLGGVDDSGETIAGVDRFDPVTGRFEELAAPPPRRGAAATSLGDGRGLVVGGVLRNGDVADYLDLISFETMSGTPVEQIEAEQLGALVAPALATLSDGSVLAIGGRNTHGVLFETPTEIATEGGGVAIRQFTETQLAVPRYGHTLTRLSDDVGAPVLIAGGQDQSGAAVRPSELYRPLIHEIAPPGEFAAEMQVPRWDHAAVRLPDGSVLIIGGRNAVGPVSSLEVFTIESGFRVQGTAPIGTGVTDFSLTKLPDGRILIAGGIDASGAPVDAVSIVRIDPVGGGIDLVNTDRLSFKRAGHEATLLCDGTVMLVGGTTEPSPAERYNPPSTNRR